MSQACDVQQIRQTPDALPGVETFLRATPDCRSLGFNGATPFRAWKQRPSQLVEWRRLAERFSSTCQRLLISTRVCKGFIAQLLYR
jgi:hypothetical protein